ncbi:MAG: DUF929 family protein [Nitrososphaerales archaeon]
MPKCDKCGKKFQNISALNDHYKAMHPNQRFIPPKTSTGRQLILGLIIVVIVIGAIVGYLVYLQIITPTSPTTTVIEPSVLNTPVSIALYNNITGVSSSTLSTIGTGQSNNPLSSVTGPSLTSVGKPEVLYIGGEYCPFCAAERWSMAVALSKFGSFSNLGYMISAANDQNLSTLTFYGSSYTSSYVSFVSVEMYDRSHASLQTPTQAESSLMSQYDSAGSIPFVDLANQYVLVGSQYTTTVISGLSWTQIGSQLNNPNSAVAKSIDGAANVLISAICKIDGAQPASICNQSFAHLSLLIPLPNFGGNSPLAISVTRTSLEKDVRI